MKAGFGGGKSFVCWFCLLSWDLIKRALWGPLRTMISPLSPSVEELPLGRRTNEVNVRETPTDHSGIGLKKA